MKLKNGDYTYVGDIVKEGDVYYSLRQKAIAQGFNNDILCSKPKYMYIKDGGVCCSDTHRTDVQTNRLSTADWLATSATWEPVAGEPAVYGEASCEVVAIVDDEAWIKRRGNHCVVYTNTLTESVKSPEEILLEDIETIADSTVVSFDDIATGLISMGYTKKEK